ncbi:MAG: hypothetical protein IJQ35_10190 [Bacteroidales bacterium]|nr:hypothetical protein [Bacteroidales bacterium]
MAALKSVQFGRILTWLKKPVVVKITTLGGASYFYAKYENEVSIMTIGIDGQHYYIDRALWKSVCARMDSLSEEEREKAGNYADTRGWNNPNHILAPDVPAICKAYLERKK